MGRSHGTRSPAAIARRGLRWVNKGGFQMANDVLARNTSELYVFSFLANNLTTSQPP